MSYISGSFKTPFLLPNGKEASSCQEVDAYLKEEMQRILDEQENGLDLSNKPTVILVVGVNGVGKTTSIGKIAYKLKKEGKWS